LLTITLTWQSSCIITNYNQKSSEIYLFKHVILLFWSWRCKEVHAKTSCLFIDKGMLPCFIICSHVQAAVFVCHNQKLWQSIDTFFANFSPFYIKGTGRERKLTKDKRKDHGAVDIPFSEQQFHKLDTITFLVWKIWSHSISATGSYGRLVGRRNVLRNF